MRNKSNKIITTTTTVKRIPQYKITFSALQTWNFSR